jgi:predicted AlkP superfamily phosphohydrolase/phosphomutase
MTSIRAAPACALAALVPMLLFNPDFARDPLEWIEAVGLCVAGPLLGAGAGALVGQAARGSAIGFAAGFALVGGIVSGVAGAVVAGVACLVVGAMTLHWSGRGTTAVAAAAVATTAALSALALGPVGDPPDRQVIVVGLDGATWRIIDDLRSEGRLPTFDRLITAGARGELDTVEPLISPPLWTTIASGKHPDEHGVKDFWTSAQDVRSKRIWEIADEQGLSSGVFGYLVTWPPEKGEGFLVPGFLAQDNRTIPPELSFLKRVDVAEAERGDLSAAELRDLIPRALRHGMTLSTLNLAVRSHWRGRVGEESRLDATLQRRLFGLALRTDVFCHLLRGSQPDLAIYYHRHIDAVSHLFFKYFEPEGFRDVAPQDATELGEAIPRIYEATDDVLRRILRRASPNATLVLVSDHGQEAARPTASPFLIVKTTTLLGHLGLSDALRATNIGNKVYLRAASPQVDMTAVLETLRSPTAVPSGRPAFAVTPRGPRDALLQTMIDPRRSRDVRVGSLTVPVGDLIHEAQRISGKHTTTAMLLLAGPTVEAGVEFPRGSVLDVTPTILTLLGLPVARDMTGRFLKEAFRGEALADLAVTYVNTYGGTADSSDAAQDRQLDAATINNLKALGYIE